MNVASLLEELIQHKVKLTVQEDKLRVQLPEGGLEPSLLEQLKLQKDAIKELILATQKPRVKRQAITRVTHREDTAVLSHMQRRLWILDKIEGSTHYNISNALVLEGDLDRVKFQTAFDTILTRHAILRTVYTTDEQEQVFQVIQPARPLDIGYDNLTGLSKETQEQAIRDLQLEETKRPFDLSRDVLIRVRLVQLNTHAHVVLVTIHHIAIDGWSMGLLIKEFCALYSGHSLPALPVQYVDYAVWQQQYLQGETLDRLKRFWAAQLAGIPPVHALPLDFTRPRVQTFNGHTFYTRIAAAPLQRLCEQQGTTLFAGLYAAFTVLLARYSNEKDIVIGTPVANREQEEVAGLAGLFMNMLVLRTQLQKGTSFIQLLQQSRQTLIDSFAHQQLPFDMLVGMLQQERNPSHSALFQVMLVLQNNEKGTVELPGVALRPMTQSKPFAMYDLSLIAEEDRHGLSLGWEYNTDLFSQATVQRMATHFEVLLQGMLANPEADVLQINILSAEEVQQLAAFNCTDKSYPAGLTIMDLYQPQHLAVTYEGNTYRELDAAANKLAAYLHHQFGVQKGDLVGLQLDRSEKMLMAILAILKSGAAYVPIGVDYPEARVEYIVADAQLRVVINENLITACVDHPMPVFERPDPSAAAYGIYTSGSTGQPKGVINEHAGLYNRLLWMRDDLGIGANDVILQKTPYTFDVSVWELLMPLITGSRLVFARPEGHKDPQYLQELIDREQVSIVHFVPSMLGIFLEELDSGKCESLRHVVCSGEALPATTVAECKEKLPWVRIHNLYGPTEAAIDVTAIDLTDTELVTIGKPVANTKIYIVDEQLRQQPVGVAGELLIEGIQVARGYINQPALTASRFIDSPFTAGARLYRTGDLAKWLPDGTISYLGRMDDQVKIRGNRIEPGEIESRILSWGHAEQAGVIVKDKRLVAYVVPKEGYQKEQLYNYLYKHLPDYMVPGIIMELEELPLTSSGKLNRRALPAPVLTDHYVAPGNEVETALAAIWQEVLGVTQVSIHDNFFRVGGDSILAIRLVSRINKHFNTAFSIPEMYEDSTIAGVSHKIINSKAVVNQQEEARDEIRKSIDNLLLELLED